MDSDNRFDRWWVGIAAAAIVGFLCYFFVGLVFSALSSSQMQATDLRPVLVSTVVLLLFARWLLVSRKWENAGKGFLLVVIPTVLVLIYKSFHSTHG